MADDDRLTAGVIFATDESRAAAIVRAKAGSREDALLLIGRFSNHEPDVLAYVAEAFWPILYDRKYNVRVELGLDPNRKRRPVTRPRPALPSLAQHLRVPVHAHAPVERLFAQWCDNALLRRTTENRFTRSMERAVQRLAAGEKSIVVLAEQGLVGARVDESEPWRSMRRVLEATKGRPDEFEELRWVAASMIIAGHSDSTTGAEVVSLLREHRARHDGDDRVRGASSERGAFNTIIRTARQEVFNLAMMSILEVRHEHLVTGFDNKHEFDQPYNVLALAYLSPSRKACEKMSREVVDFICECNEVDEQYQSVAWTEDADIKVSGRSTTWQEWAASARVRTGRDIEELLELCGHIGKLVLQEIEARG